jgi:hypothetical protein
MTLLQSAHWSFYVVGGAALALGLCRGYQHAASAMLP